MAAATYFTGNLRANAARGDWADAAAVWNDSASQAINCTGAPAIGAAKPRACGAAARWVHSTVANVYRGQSMVALSETEFHDTVDAYGNTLIFTAADSSGNWWSDSAAQSSHGANDIIYCGYRYDAETDNYYVRNRYYSPVLGRWLTRDPIGYQGGINLYGHVENGPVGMADASGEAWIGGMNLSPPSPAPPLAPKKCCPPFPLLVNTWKQWVADYRKAQAMHSALMSQHRSAHGIGNDYDTVLAEYQNAEDTILIAEIDLQSMKFLAMAGDIERVMHF